MGVRLCYIVVTVIFFIGSTQCGPRVPKATLDTASQLEKAQNLMKYTLSVSRDRWRSPNLELLKMATIYLKDSMEAHKESRMSVYYSRLRTAERLLSDSISKYRGWWNREDINRLIEARHILDLEFQKLHGYDPCGDWTEWSPCSVSCGSGQRTRHMRKCPTLKQYMSCHMPACVATPEKICVTPSCVNAASFTISAMNASVDPCDDFYEYACGTWIDENPIPDDRSSYGSFSKMTERVGKTLKGLLNSDIKDTDIDAVKKLKVLYKSCMDEDTINNRGISPLLDYVASLGGWSLFGGETGIEKLSLEEMLAFADRNGFSSFIEIIVMADQSDPTNHIILLGSSGVTLSREWYLNKTKYGKNLENYKEYVTDTLVLLGADRRKAKVLTEEVFDLETKLAGMMMSYADFDKAVTENYNKWRLDEWRQKVSYDFNWNAFINNQMRTVGIYIGDHEEVAAIEDDYMRKVVQYLRSLPKKTIADYIMYNAVIYETGRLGEEFQDLNAEIDEKLYDVSASPRWEVCLDYAHDLPLVTGRLFVEKYFPRSYKQGALDMISNIQDQMNDAIRTADWMSPSTRRRALEKAAVMTNMIGYPEVILNDTALNEIYKPVNFSAKTFFENELNFWKLGIELSYKMLRQKVNKNQWAMGAFEVNAYYHRLHNAIVFTAGILQEPMFYGEGPSYVNYARIGMIIGHEITHGFDDAGRKYDKDGALRNWWSESSNEAFKKKAKCIIEQYDDYTLEEVGKNLNGEFTAGENIADAGGVKLAYKAFINHRQQVGKEGVLPGLNLSEEQLFFLSYAQVWCGHYRKEIAEMLIWSDPHSTPKYRVIGPLSHSPDFVRAYNCPVGSKMNAQNKCQLW